VWEGRGWGFQERGVISFLPKKGKGKGGLLILFLSLSRGRRRGEEEKKKQVPRKELWWSFCGQLARGENPFFVMGGGEGMKSEKKDEKGEKGYFPLLFQPNRRRKKGLSPSRTLLERGKKREKKKKNQIDIKANDRRCLRCRQVIRIMYFARRERG